MPTPKSLYKKTYSQTRLEQEYDIQTLPGRVNLSELPHGAFFVYAGLEPTSCHQQVRRILQDDTDLPSLSTSDDGIERVYHIQQDDGSLQWDESDRSVYRVCVQAIKWALKR